MTDNSINQIIVNHALSKVGIEEIPGNQGWNDKKLQKRFEEAGWNLGQAYCSYTGEIIWVDVYNRFNSMLAQKMEQLFSSNAVKTYENFKKAGFKTNIKPIPGALIIWQKKKNNKPVKVDIWTLGHLGIVTSVMKSYFQAVEGNSNKKGTREGGVIAINNRKYDYKVDNGLEIIGFIYPPKPDNTKLI